MEHQKEIIKRFWSCKYPQNYETNFKMKQSYSFIHLRIPCTIQME